MDAAIETPADDQSHRADCFALLGHLLVPGIHDLWLFIISGLLPNITPGPDTAYITGRSLQMG
jgi:hypothetical protein